MNRNKDFLDNCSAGKAPYLESFYMILTASSIGEGFGDRFFAALVCVVKCWAAKNDLTPEEVITLIKGAFDGFEEEKPRLQSIYDDFAGLMSLRSSEDKNNSDV